MDKRTPAFARILEARRGIIKLTMAAAVVALTPLVVPQRADAQYSVSADSDGYVPVYDVCFAGPEVGYYSWYNDGYTTFGEISIDSCLLDSYGASPADYDRVLAHEQGHAAGYGHSSDPNSIMYPYAYIFQGGEQYEAQETEQYETEQYEAPEPEQPAPEDEQYAMDLTSEVQQYEPGQEADETEQAPDIREVPREELPAVRIVDEAEKKAEEKRETEKKDAEKRDAEKREAERRKKDAEQDEAVDRVRMEAAALAQAVDSADTLTDEETRNRAEALARTLEEGEGEGKDGPLADARTEAKDMAASLTDLGERDDEPARDRVQAVAETREKAENLAGALDRAGAEAGSEDRTKDLDEASADVRTVASKLDRAETEIEDQETEQRQAAQDRPAEGQSTEAQNTEQGFFSRLRDFFASTFG